MESAVDGLQVPGATSAGGLSPLGLLAPVVLASLSSGVTAVSTGVLLDVQGAATAASAQSVRLVVALSEAGGTLRHLESEGLVIPLKGGLSLSSSLGVSEVR